MTDETLEQLSDRELLLNLTREFSELKKRLDGYDAQFEAIRTGLVLGSAAFDRLQARFLNLNADVTEMIEEVRRMKRETFV
jgi:uncharacterized coiled-coil DUF342 family protein